MAPGQLMWSTLGVALFLGVLFFLKDHRVLQRYTYISMVVALILLILPMFFPARFGAGSGSPFRASARSSRASSPRSSSRSSSPGYLMVKRDALALASRRFMGMYLPAAGTSARSSSSGRSA